MTNEILATNEVDSIKGDNKLIEKYEKLLKTEKLSKFQKKIIKKWKFI